MATRNCPLVANGSFATLNALPAELRDPTAPKLAAYNRQRYGTGLPDLVAGEGQLIGTVHIVMFT